jgi:hypothetical protein
MFISRKGKFDLKNLSRVGMAIVVAGLLSACEQGDTDGGEAVDVSDSTFPEFVSNGGSLQIDLTTSRLELGGKGGFFVRVRDANGAPIEGIRISCFAENGLDLFSGINEITNDNGEVSGNFCGVAGGSFILECRAPIGFNLIDRDSVVVSHDGNGECKGSGDTTTTLSDAGEGIGGRIAAISYSDAGGDTISGPLDIEAGQCADGSAEPFGPVRFNLALENASDFAANSVSFTFSGSGGVISTGPLAIDSADGNTLSGVLENIEGVASAGAGTYAVSVAVDGQGADGTISRLSAQSTVTFGSVDNC